MENINSVWGFVEEYYPNYSSCDEILRNNDLTNAIEEGEEGLEEQLKESNAYVFEKAIEGYIKSFKTTEGEKFKMGIYWTTNDFKEQAAQNFIELKKDNPEEFKHLENWEQLYDKTKFPHELERMISGHDASIGITWLTIEEHLSNCEIR